MRSIEHEAEDLHLPTLGQIEWATGAGSNGTSAGGGQRPRREHQRFAPCGGTCLSVRREAVRSTSVARGGKRR
jgi:hypothetical protein